MNKITTVVAGIILVTIGTLSFDLNKAEARESRSIEKLCVFGDSLSDVGNDLALTDGSIPPPERYFAGRFSNGPVAADYLAIAQGLELQHSAEDPGCQSSTSFAYGGSGTGIANITPGGFEVRGLRGQVADFSAATDGSADPEALYVIWSGANDYLLTGLDLEVPEGGPPETVSNIVTAIENLYAIGARKFLVLNLPNLGNIPIAAIIDQTNPGTQDALTNATLAHNALLASALSDFQDIHIYTTDVYALFAEISMDPSSFGFTNSFTDPGPAVNCLTGPQNCDPIEPDRYDADGSVFWDSQHPSTALHLLVAGEMLETLDIPTATIAMDILPGKDPNLFDPRRRFLPIAVLTTNRFDALQVDPISVRLQPSNTRTVPGLLSVKDVDQDGDDDLVLQFKTQRLDLACGDNTVLVLTGRSYDEQLIIGSDSIKVDCDVTFH